jgi:hypothetical protein
VLSRSSSLFDHAVKHRRDKCGWRRRFTETAICAKPPKGYCSTIVHVGLDCLIEYGTEPIPDVIPVLNSAWRKPYIQIRSKSGPRHRLDAQFRALAVSEDPTKSQLQGFQ